MTFPPSRPGASAGSPSRPAPPAALARAAAQAPEMADEIRAITSAWDAPGQEISAALGAAVETAGQSLAALCGEVAALADAGQPSLASQLRSLAAGLTEAVTCYAGLENHEFDASIDIFDRLAPCIALVLALRPPGASPGSAPQPIPPAPAECVIHLAGGAAIRTATWASSPADSSYVAVCAADGREIAYWDSAEWAEDPEGVMGAILGAAAAASRACPPHPLTTAGAAAAGNPEGAPRPGSSSGPYRLADAAPAWLAAEVPPARLLYNQDTAALISDAASTGIIAGGPPGASLSADCCADRDGYRTAGGSWSTSPRSDAA